MKIPISVIGEIQEKDILKSSGNVLYDGTGRLCTIVKPQKSFDDRRDTAPMRMANLFGGKWEDYNEHYIIQVSGCPLKCWYCYVDNLKPNKKMDAEEIVYDFHRMRRQSYKCDLPEINVLHLMGGDPGRYPEFWKELRESMNESDLKRKILFSDVIFCENYFYDVKPWEFLNLENFILTGCLKGTNRENFQKNTGFDLFDQSLRELEKYADHENFYLSLINYSEEDLPRIFSIIPSERIDFLKVINYEVTKSKCE